jgi:hypothetical protein
MTTRTKARARFFALILVLTASAAHAAGAIVAEELAVVQAMATIINGEAKRPYDYLYFESDFPSKINVESGLANPDRDSFCGLSRDKAGAMVSELARLEPVEYDKPTAKSAGLGIGHKKFPRFRYLVVSRVIFDAENRSAWLAVDLNGETGALMRLDKVDGAWTKAARCAGWVRVE